MNRSNLHCCADSDASSGNSDDELCSQHPLHSVANETSKKIDGISRKLQQLELLSTTAKDIDATLKGLTAALVILFVLFSRILFATVRITLLSSHSTYTVIKCSLQTDLVTLGHVVNLWLVFLFQVATLASAAVFAIVSVVVAAFRIFLQSWNGPLDDMAGHTPPAGCKDALQLNPPVPKRRQENLPLPPESQLVGLSAQ